MTKMHLLQPNKQYIVLCIIGMLEQGIEVQMKEVGK